jgi:hypothetical protein
VAKGVYERGRGRPGRDEGNDPIGLNLIHSPLGHDMVT